MSSDLYWHLTFYILTCNRHNTGSVGYVGGRSAVRMGCGSLQDSGSRKIKGVKKAMGLVQALAN
jgi:hypothetical protein